MRLPSRSALPAASRKAAFLAYRPGWPSAPVATCRSLISMSWLNRAGLNCMDMVVKYRGFPDRKEYPQGRGISAWWREASQLSD